ncbi:uncharacterized protein B0P05DRAFT_545828 [Gilbertella persicaria]|uniref:Uncharacterized protein n=1 Tax=Rhizopus stolonifer TaxID=4846 RepID=A0A367KTS0_RHIST|nr:uncharacterized protein B0P05DRAFT_545828 [Gilbertella persicaria]KAI8076424.1 hypothetical protein B0P05DRAFT_545828 [Gilbertella persicaria]RCI05520.1 hypothetical protein CU098_013040 [Rhizopus stolonifer]
MKFITFASSFIGAAVLMASTAVADVDFMMSPGSNTCFAKGETVQFVFECDDHERLYADLYRSNGRRVQSVRKFNIQYSHGDDCSLEWVVDRNLSNGRYFLEVCSEDSDDEDDFSDDDDCSRSFTFEVTSSNRGSSGSTRGNRISRQRHHVRSLDMANAYATGKEHLKERQSEGSKGDIDTKETVEGVDDGEEA